MMKERMNLQDLMDLFPDFAPISASQQEILQRKRFEKDPFPEIHDDVAAEVIIIPTNHHTNIASSSTNPIISPPLSRPDFLVDIQGVVHAPSEETYHLVSAAAADNVDVRNCSFNTADDDDETLGLMDDFRNDSHLGFPENLPSVEGDGLAEMDCDEITVSERLNSDSGEPPQKKMISLEMNVQDANAGNVEVINIDDDDDDDDDDIQREIPRRTEEGKDLFLFAVLRVIAEHQKKIDGKNINPITLLETAKRSGNPLALLEAAKHCGITFPCPPWLPKDHKSKIFKYDDEV